MKNQFAKLDCMMCLAGAALSTTLLIPSGATAASVVKNFGWTGDDGYYMAGSFTYDDSFSIIYANSDGSTDGLDELSASFFDSGHILVETYQNVTAGVSSNHYLRFSSDTSTMSPTPGSVFDVGHGARVEGELFFVGFEGGNAFLGIYEKENVTSGVDFSVGFSLAISDPNSPDISPVSLPAAGFLLLGGSGALGSVRRYGRSSTI
jgi:hypothetical protein